MEKALFLKGSFFSSLLQLVGFFSPSSLLHLFLETLSINARQSHSFILVFVKNSFSLWLLLAWSLWTSSLVSTEWRNAKFPVNCPGVLALELVNLSKGGLKGLLSNPSFCGRPGSCGFAGQAVKGRAPPFSPRLFPGAGSHYQPQARHRVSPVVLVHTGWLLHWDGRWIGGETFVTATELWS